MRARSAPFVFVFLFVLCVSGAGCGGGGDGSGFVLVDRELREGGLELRVDGRPVAANLPVEVADPASRVELVRGGTVTRVDLEGGSLVWMRGPDASIARLAVGADVRA